MTTSSASSTSSDQAGIEERLRRSQDPSGEIAALLTTWAGDGRLVQLESSPSPLDAVARIQSEGRLRTGAFPLGPFEALGNAIAAELERRPRSPLQHSAWTWLNMVRSGPVPVLIGSTSAVDRWMSLILRVIDASGFTLARMFHQRLEQYGPHTLFRVPSRGRSGEHTWIEVSLRIDRIARGLLALLEQRGPGPVAVLAENRLEMALVDLACLTSGITNVMIPTSASDSDVSYILEQTGARVLFTTEEQRRRYKRSWHGIHQVKTVVMLDGRSEGPGALALDALEQREHEVSGGQLSQLRDRLALDDLASIMFTSGTSGRPKGIRFSQRNLVCKRFARGLAIPEIGDHDRFLAYLPLCHTFGRYLEMLGSVFWGATYIFLEDHAPDSMVAAFRSHSPTVFISIPLKWYQLYDAVQRQLEGHDDSEEAAGRATSEVVGEQLRWGLSAAGYLAPEIFRHFQKHGVELMSGYGMTEATGGITMTPPGKYVDGTLGVALPAIEIELGDEMLIRGPYVSSAYVDESDNEKFYRDGWLRTGDVMERDQHGYLRLVDRKKHIYKNVKGQTVAPQRVENLFRDLESVKRVYLVGDHREYNTALIVPNPIEPDAQQAQYDHFGSIVATVNRFVAPHERIVDFAVLDRDFEQERGELTTKGTFRRKQIEQSMSEVIERLYQRGRLQVAAADLEVRLPNWLFQALGVTVAGIKVEGNRIVAGADRTLCVDRVERGGERLLQIGSCLYRVRGNRIDMGKLLSFPVLWIGNDELVSFASLEERRHTASHRWPDGIELVGPAEPLRPTATEREALAAALAGGRTSFGELHLAAHLLGSEDELDALQAVRLLEVSLSSEDRPVADVAQHLLQETATHPSLEVRRRAVQCLLPTLRAATAQRILERFLGQPEDVLDEQTIGVLCERALPAHVVQALVELTRRALVGSGATEQWRRRRQIECLLELLVSYGGGHPAEYAALQIAFASLEIAAPPTVEREQVARAQVQLVERFRRWLGPPQRIAVDPDTQREYRWEDVLTFDDDVDPEDRQRMLSAVRGTSLVQEAIFLVSRGTVVRLSDIRPGGVWISRQRQTQAEVVYRTTVHTRFLGRHDFVIHLSRMLSAEELAEETLWLRCAGSDSRLVAVFAGSWQQHDLWTEEFVAGETVDRFVRRLERQKRLRSSWSFIVWDAATAYFEFWERTGRQYVLDPAPSNYVVAPDDYQPGARIISIARRRPFSCLADELELFRHTFVDPLVAEHPIVEGIFDWRFLFSAVLEAVGVEQGLALIEEVGARPALAGPVEQFCAEVRQRGFAPRRLYFAISRYHDWSAVAVGATPEARARTLGEIYGTYRLESLQAPEVRVRLFRETVLRDSPEPVLQALDKLIDGLRQRRIGQHEIVGRVAQLRAQIDLDESTAYFLTRMTYPHLEPGDAADMLLNAPGGKNDVVVTLEDRLGRPYQIRRPTSPHEITSLQRLFRRANIDVSFHGEHRFLIALDVDGSVIGGLYFELDLDSQMAQMGKLVVTERRRKQGLSDGLMNELFKRVAADGVRVITTGFYRPGFFYRFGFAIEKRFAGLVKHLA